MQSLTKEERQLIVDEILEKINEKLENWPNKRTQKGGCVMSRAKIEQIWNALSQTTPKTVAEITAATGISKNVLHHGLYILLAEGRAWRRPREGRLYEYFQKGESSTEGLEPESNVFDINRLREAIPRGQDSAVTTSELIKAVNASSNTVRNKLKLLEVLGEIKKVQGRTDKGVPVWRFFRD
jgi:predicted Rossmann fold nucleotide-binding protein DprA/Smf involved in DNA uptake